MSRYKYSRGKQLVELTKTNNPMQELNSLSIREAQRDLFVNDLEPVIHYSKDIQKETSVHSTSKECISNESIENKNKENLYEHVQTEAEVDHVETVESCNLNEIIENKNKENLYEHVQMEAEVDHVETVESCNLNEIIENKNKENLYEHVQMEAEVDHVETVESCNLNEIIENNSIEQQDENARKGLVEYSASSEDYSCDDSDNDPTYQLDNNGQDIYSDESMDYQSLEENTGNQSFKARWRLKNEQNWKVNIIKENRACCLPYNNKKKSCPAKAPKEINCFRCRFNCSENFNEEDRINICKSYWALKEYKRQKDFLINHVQVLEPKRRKVNESNSNRRAVSKCYYLSNSIGKFRVCAKFFEKTLCISNGPINTAIEGKSHVGCYEGDDHRGKKIPGNKTKDEQLALVKEHIQSFPCIEAHYVRQSSQKKYLDANLSILKMYALYKELCAEKQVEAVSEPTYRRIFSTSFNLSFHKPKKDQCPSCSKYLSADANQKNEMELEYSMHIIRKNECNEAKDLDKQRSLTDPSFQTVNFDLQSVLQLPFSSISQFYYCRKLCVYNLTFYEGNGNNAYCYAWNEINGKRGSNEIGSSILRYIQTLKEEVTHLSMFSDTCSGQNRNQQVAAALLYAVQNTHLTVIEQKFLESGHTHMECDSMHSSIENARKNKTCFMMNDWLNIFKDARSNRGKNKDKAPYQVMELKYKDVWDLQALAACTLKNKNTDENGEKVNWLKIKCLKFEKAYPHALFYRYDHSSEYKIIDIQQRSRRNRISQNVELKQAYNAVLPISMQKKNDLVKLCRSGLIPDELHDWYKNLPANGSLRQNDIFELEDENDNF